MKTFLLAFFAITACAFAQVSDVPHSTAYEAGHALKASPGTLLYLSGYNSKGSAQFIQIHDAAAVPSDVVSGVAEIFTVAFASATPAGLADKYITAADANGAVYFWFNLDAGGTDPAQTGRAIEVAITTGDTAAQLGDSFAAAVDAEAQFTATNSTSTVTVTNAAAGARTDANAGNSGRTVNTTQQGVTAVAASVPIAVITAAASSNFSFILPATGLPCSNGISVCNSSTGPTKTAGSADCFFTATVK